MRYADAESKLAAGGSSTTCERSGWFNTVAEAKKWIEDATRERLVKVAD